MTSDVLIPSFRLSFTCKSCKIKTLNEIKVVENEMIFRPTITSTESELKMGLYSSITTGWSKPLPQSDSAWFDVRQNKQWAREASRRRGRYGPFTPGKWKDGQSFRPISNWTCSHTFIISITTICLYTTQTQTTSCTYCNWKEEGQAKQRRADRRRKTGWAHKQFQHQCHVKWPLHWLNIPLERVCVLKLCGRGTTTFLQQPGYYNLSGS